VQIRPFRPADAPDVASLSAACARREADFVLNPLWEREEDLFAEFERHGIEPAEHLLVADGEEEGIAGLAGYLRAPRARHAGLFCPVVRPGDRGRGVGGRLLRAALALGGEELGIELATAGVGTRNRAGYALLAAFGFRPVRQVFVMRCDAKPEPAPLPDPAWTVDAARPEDVDAILEIYTACGFPPRGPDDVARLLADGRHEHGVARDAAGRVVAFVELETHWPRRPWVAYVGVLPELRDRGLGSGLVGHALARRFEGGAEAALLTLGPANRTAVGAYEKVGFRRWRLVDVLERALP